MGFLINIWQNVIGGNQGGGGSQPVTVDVSTATADPVYDFIDVSIVFSEAVSGFVAGDIITSGVVSNFATSDNITFTARVTASTTGPLDVSVAAGVVTPTNEASNILTKFCYVFDVDFLAWLAASNAKGYTFSDINEQVFLSAFFTALKASGNGGSTSAWTLSDKIWILFNTSGSNQMSRIEVKGRSDTFLYDYGGSTTYVSGQGIKGNGSSGYIDFKYTPNAHAVKLTQNNIGVCIYLTENIDENKKQVSMNDSASNFFVETGVRSSNSGLVYVADFTANSGANTSSIGMFFLERTAGNSKKLKKYTPAGGLVEIATGTAGSNALGNGALQGLCRKIGGTRSLFATNTLGLMMVGAAYAGLEAQIGTAYNNLITGQNNPVPSGPKRIVYVLFGQSNTKGTNTGPPSDANLIGAIANVKISTLGYQSDFQTLEYGVNNLGNAVGPELSIGYYTEDATFTTPPDTTGGLNVYMAKVAYGGVSISDVASPSSFYPTRSLYPTLELATRNARNSVIGLGFTPVIIGVMVGLETEAGNPATAGNVKASIEAIDDALTTAGCGFDYLVVAKVDTTQHGSTQAATVNTQLGLLQAADPTRIFLIETNPSTYTADGIHRTADSQTVIGQRIVSVVVDDIDPYA